MRKIKFRAWDKREGRMIHRPNIPIPCMPESDLYILMQYTGLEDKNGKEIYEGDVLNNGHYKTQVYWNEHTGAWSHRSTNVDDALYIYLASNTTFDQELLFEIIGNIYENPELAEQGIV